MNADFRSLTGGKQFLVSVELGRNGSFIKTTAHIDGGANIFGALCTSVALQLRDLLGVKFLNLPKPIIPTGYNGQAGAAITHVILLTLTIDRRRVNFPFMITDLGSNNVLISRKFLEHYKLKQNNNRRTNNCLE